MICAKDDSGTCCGLCHYNPIVVMATHQRKEITSLNIKLLKKQSFVPKILIVCSTHDEFEFYKPLGVSVIMEPNQPLGRKWQCGVNAALNMNADPIIILGSDDLLHPDYIKKGLQKLNSGFDFVGTTAWFNYDTKSNRVYKCHYQGVNVDFPIGSGKMYSKKLVTQVRSKIFDTQLNKRLDDQGHRMTKGYPVYLEREPMILAVKGNWIVLNETHKYLRSPNIKVERSTNEILKEFGYV